MITNFKHNFYQNNANVISCCSSENFLNQNKKVNFVYNNADNKIINNGNKNIILGERRKLWK